MSLISARNISKFIGPRGPAGPPGTPGSGGNGFNNQTVKGQAVGGQTPVFDTPSNAFLMHSAQLVKSVKEFGAVGNGVADDTAAIQAALNYFSGRANLLSGTLFFPVGTYLISTSLTFTGNVGSGIRLVGEGSGLTTGVVIRWIGAAGGTMFNTYGLNSAEIDNIVFDANQVNSAANGIWLHSDQPGGGAGCNLVWFRKCNFFNMLGADSSGVSIGDSGTQYEVNFIYFDFCTWDGLGAGLPSSSWPKAAVNIRATGAANTEEFHFRACAFNGWQYDFYAPFNNNPTTFSHGTSFGNFVQAAIYQGGSGQVLVTGCGCENGVGTGKQGVFYASSSASCSCHIVECEIVMEAANNNSLAAPLAGLPSGCIFVCAGTLVIEDSTCDASGLGADTTVTNALVTNGTLSGNDCLTIRNCLWGTGNTTQAQLQITDGSNGYTLGQYGQSVSLNVVLENNRGLNTTTDIPYRFPDHRGRSFTLNQTGLLGHNGSFQAPVLVQSEPRTVLTTYDINYTDAAFKQNSGNVYEILGLAALRTSIRACVAETITAWQGSGVTGVTLEVGFDGAGALNELILSHDVHTGATNKGLADADMGSGLARATAVQGVDFTAWTGNPNAKATFSAATGTFGNGTATNLTQGHTRVHVLSEFFGYI